MTTSWDPDKIYAEIITAGNDWADRKSAFEFLDDASKSVLADLMPTGMSNAAAEREALANPKWKQHLETKAKARHEYLKADVLYKTMVLLAEMRRSQEATRRAEAKIL